MILTTMLSGIVRRLAGYAPRGFKQSVKSFIGISAVHDRLGRLEQTVEALLAETGEQAQSIKQLSMSHEEMLHRVKLFSITFVVPLQSKTIGGVYSITQYAVYMAKFARVNIVVETGPTHEIPGVTVVEAKLDAVDKIPNADAILLYSDSREGDLFDKLPAIKGTKIIFFQGYGTPDDEYVIRNLNRGHEVITCSHWVQDEALKYTKKTRFVTFGIDKTIFFETNAPRDPNRVAFMTHFADWKGTDDGLRALAVVKQRKPGMNCVFFGVREPGPLFSADEYYPNVSRQEVAEIMRGCALYVCSSWEEGLGMPGYEALACGAALATTDTKGNREYAINGETALVSPPKDPESLANNILRLLENSDLRHQIAKRGQLHVLKTYPSWEDAAFLFLEAVLRAVRGLNGG